MVRIHPDPPTRKPRACTKSGGAIAQLGERLLCKQEVIGSIPIGSTSNMKPGSSNQTRGSGVDWCFFIEASIGCSLTIRDRR